MLATSTRCVLVVDDDWDLLLMVRSALEAEGYNVLPALNGVDALVHVERRLAGQPALILTDLKMPLLHGWEFIRAFRTQWGDDVPIVVMTGGYETVPPELRQDVAAVLRKPFDVDKLVDTIRRFVP